MDLQCLVASNTQAIITLAAMQYTIVDYPAEKIPWYFLLW